MQRPRGRSVLVIFQEQQRGRVTDTEEIKEKVMEMRSEGARGLSGRILQTTVMTSDVYSS